jgi:hypothetical protein
MSELYQVIRTTEGYEEHTTDLSHTEAVELVTELESCFEGEQYEVHPQPEPTPVSEYRTIPNGAADGWEDLFC